MKLLVIIVCLLSERYLIHKIGMSRFNWLKTYSEKVKKIMENQTMTANPWLLILLTVLPLCLVPALVYWLFGWIFFGLFGLLLNILIFYYCLGPDNPFYPPGAGESSFSASRYFAQLDEQLFSVILWYVIAGPVAIIALRSLCLLQSDETYGQEARRTYSLLQWISARLTAVLYLLVGNFQAGIKVLIQYFWAPPKMNQTLLIETSIAAAQIKEDAHFKVAEAEAFVNHAIIVYLFVLAMFTYAAMI